MDVAVVGSGPNGLAAAVTLARAGVNVTVFEAATQIGGGVRTAEWVLPGVRHDVCAAIHPLALISPFFREFELTQRVRVVTPAASFAQVDGDGIALAWRDFDRTAAAAPGYRGILGPLLPHADSLFAWILAERMPTPVAREAARFALATARIAARAGRRDPASRLLAGAAAHALRRLPQLGAAGVGVMLALAAHTVGWPVPVGGSGAIAAALADDLRAHGGRIRTGQRVRDIAELDDFDAAVFDTSARDLARIAAARLPAATVRRLEGVRVGAGAAKVDFVLDGDVPWQDDRLRQTATVHLGAAGGGHPFVLLAQPDLFDPDRNPPGAHAIWTYTHVRGGSHADMTALVTAMVERAAPGFSRRILAVRCTTAAELERHNSNYIGGDIAAGAATAWQLAHRPPHRVARGIYLASAFARPGPGVHGLAGWYAARALLDDVCITPRFLGL